MKDLHIGPLSVEEFVSNPIGLVLARIYSVIEFMHACGVLSQEGRPRGGKVMARL